MGICAQDEKQKLGKEATIIDIHKSRIVGKKEMERLEEELADEEANR